MKIKFNVISLIFLTLISPIVYAEIIVAPVTTTEETRNNYVIRPGQYLAVPLPSMKTEQDTYSITVNSDNAVYKDITAYLVDENNLQLFTQRLQYQGIGYTRTQTPFTIQGSTQTPGQHYLILDNTYAAFITKKLNVAVKAAFPSNENLSQTLKTQLGKVYDGLKTLFVFKDFNIHVEPCGQVNAFSESFTSGDIHICTELLDNVSKSKNSGAFGFIVLHELGHSFLGLWGLPGNNNEDIADEFATFIMLQGNSAQGVMLEKSLDFWRNRDSTAEAMNMIKNGDRHSLSVQRIRNIEENIKNNSVFCKRWSQLIYPHMTPQGLKEVVNRPNGCSDIELAQSILSQGTTATKTAKSSEVVRPPEPDQSKNSVAERLKGLEKLHRGGLISKEEYNAKRKEVLNSL